MHALCMFMFVTCVSYQTMNTECHLIIYNNNWLYLISLFIKCNSQTFGYTFIFNIIYIMDINIMLY